MSVFRFLSPRNLSLRWLLPALVVLSLLPPAGLTVYTYLGQRSSSMDRVEEETLSLARLILNQREGGVREVRHLLQTLSHVPIVQAADPNRCGAFLTRFVYASPQYLNLGVIGPDGLLRCSALLAEGGVDLSDRKYFRDALMRRNFSIGEYQVGRVTGRPSVNFGHPILDAYETPAGVVFAAVDLEWLNHLPDRVLLPPDAAVALLDHEGIVLAHHPEPRRWVGRDVSGGPVFRRALSGGRGVFSAEGADGEPMLVAFTTFESFREEGKIHLTVSVPKKVVLAEANRTFQWNIAGLALFGLIGLLIAYPLGHFLVLRLVKALVGATRRFAAGDLSARTGLLPYGKGETGRLARAFDEMAESIEKMQRQMVQSEKLSSIGTLVAGVTHEIMNPVTVIGLKLHAIEGLLKDIPEGGRAALRDAVAEVEEQIRRITKISRSLLDFSRRGEPTVQELDVREVVGRVLDLMEPQFKLNNVQAFRDFPKASVDVMGDKDQLNQVFVNLVSNALDAMPSGGKLWNRIRPVEREGRKWALIAVEDTGPGIPEGIIGRIFDPFFTTKGDDKGTGLGLSVTHGIIEEHGGRIDVRSVEGLGTTFLIELPAGAKGGDPQSWEES